MTYDYLEDSQRGPSELTSIDKEENTTGGLDLSYMTNWVMVLENLLIY